MFKVGIIGATGYVGVELLRLLLNHDKVTVTAISSSTFKDEEISSVYKSFFNKTTLVCEDKSDVIDKCDVIFTALPHGLSEEIAVKAISKNKKVIDLGADFRLECEDSYEEWYGKKFTFKDIHKNSIYGLPEFNGSRIKKFNIVANPGCYPTCSILSIYPLAKAGLIDMNTLIIDAKSGTSGAGRGAKVQNLYCEVNESIKAYGVASHRHTPEIEEQLGYASSSKVLLNFTPHLIPMNRGILITAYASLKDGVSEEDVKNAYDIYKDEYFVRVLKEGNVPEVRNVKCSNFVDVAYKVDPRTHRVIMMGAMDNLVKGAAGQAIQNMNITFGLDEKTGLMLAPAML